MQQLKATDLRRVLGRETFAFTCTQCGNCCRGPGSVYFTPAEFQGAVDYLGLDESEARALRKRIVQSEENGYLVHNTPSACRFLTDQGACSIYPVRPMQCRTYPFWASFFQSEDDFDFLRAECPGVRSGKGKKYTLLQTVRRINATERAFLAEQRDKKNAIDL